MEAPFRLGDWLVQPRLNRIFTPEGEIPLQPKAMEVLAYLARRPAEVVTKEELFRDVWAGAFVSDEALTYAIWELRRALGDDARQPRFIQTVSRRGYRLIAPVSFEGPSNATSEAPGRARRSDYVTRLSLAALILASGTSAWWLSRSPMVSDSPAHNPERKWVLIGRFENGTGEVIWDKSLEYLLEEEILRSSAMNVVPRERVGDTLRLMKRSLDTAIDSALAREIAMRDGAIDVILVGRIEKGGPGYRLSLRAIDPPSGATISTAIAEALTRDDVGGALRDISDSVRRTLGEDLSLGGEIRAIPKVTTSSLTALQLFSQGLLFVDEKDWEGAVDLLERAVAQDPEFASAHIYLAHSYNNLERYGDASQHYQKAFALADTVPDRERYFILGSYYGHRGEEENASRAYGILVRLYPDHFWGLNNLAISYAFQGRTAEALPFALRAADLRPNDFIANSRAASYLMAHEGRTTHRPYFHRATALISSEIVNERPWEIASLAFFPAQESWNVGDVPRARAEVERLSRSTESHGSAAAAYLIEKVGRAYLSLGLIQAAEQKFRALPVEERRAYFLAQVALARGRETSFAREREALDVATQIRSYGLDASAFVLSGDIPRSSPSQYERIVGVLESMQDDLPPGDLVADFVRRFLPGVRGEAALAEGRVADALPLLEQAVDQLRARPRPAYFLAVESLAEALERQGNKERAAQVLKEASHIKQRAFEDGLFWMRVTLRLTELYRDLGYEAEALQTESELRRLLVFADLDHVVLRALDGKSKRNDDGPREQVGSR